MAVLTKIRYENNTNFNRCLLLDGANEVNNLVKDITKQNIIDDIIYGDVTKWLISLMYFPLRIRGHNEVTRLIKFGSNVAEYTRAYGLSRYNTRTYYLNSYDCSSFPYNYRYIEPYCSCEVILPFYGKAEIPLWYFRDNNFINFYLTVDLVNGSARYLITASNSKPSFTNDPIAEEIRELYYINLPVNEYFIQEIPFNLGYQIPINSTGESDRQARLAISSLSAAAAIATGGIALPASMGASTVTKSTSTVTSQITPKTRPVKTTSKETTTKTSETRNSATPTSAVTDFVNTSIQSGINILNSLELKGNSSNCQSSSLYDSLSRDIIIYFHRKGFTELRPATFGRPYGKYVQLSSLSGYATIGNIRIDNFIGTSTELTELKDLLASGVIFN